MAEISTKPYLIRAIHEWCTDSGYRPYIAVAVDERTVVPREFVRNGEIVLNISAAATNRLSLGNELIEFEARFGGVPRAVSVPIENVSAIYAQETGHGMAFEVPKELGLTPGEGPGEDAGLHGDPGPGGSEATGPAPAGERAAGKAKGTEGAGGSGASRADGEGEGRPRLAAVPPAGARSPRRRRGEPRSGKDEAAAPGDEAGASPRPTRAEDAGSAGGRSPSDDDPKPPAGRPRLTRIK